jgi:hypothetical protein
MLLRWFAGKSSASKLLGGIRIRLVGMVLMVALPLVAVQTFELYKDRERDIEAAHTKALDTARHGVERYQSTIVAVRALLDTISLVPDVVSGSAATCAAFLQRAGQKLAWAGEFLIFDPDGRIVCATIPAAVGADRSDRDYFKQALATREFAVNDLVIARVLGTPTYIATLPVLDANGNVIRVLSISLRLNWFTSLLPRLGPKTVRR